MILKMYLSLCSGLENGLRFGFFYSGLMVPVSVVLRRTVLTACAKIVLQTQRFCLPEIQTVGKFLYWCKKKLKSYINTCLGKIDSFRKKTDTLIVIST